MIIKCDRRSEALVLAQELRIRYSRTVWVVTIFEPLFVGDDWRVVVS